MTDVVRKLTWADVTSNGGGVPERMADLGFVHVADVLNEPMVITDFETYESAKDKAKGVHIVCRLEDGHSVRVCTRAVALVRMFTDHDEAALRELLAEEYKTRFVKVKTKSGREAIVLEPLDDPAE